MTIKHIKERKDFKNCFMKEKQEKLIIGTQILREKFLEISDGKEYISRHILRSFLMQVFDLKDGTDDQKYYRVKKFIYLKFLFI